LNGIAKGYGVDRLTEVAREGGIDAGLFAIDGELRALGTQPDGRSWTVAVERPGLDERAPHSVLELRDAAVATSGDYRRWRMGQGRRLSHTINPATGAPVGDDAPGLIGFLHACIHEGRFSVPFHGVTYSNLPRLRTRGFVRLTQT
jgi:thiamine biosynthesis lipoprotein